MLFWTPLNFIIWTKTIETFFKTSSVFSRRKKVKESRRKKVIITSPHMFGMTWGEVIDERVLFSGWTESLRLNITYNNEMHVLRLDCFCSWLLKFFSKNMQSSIQIMQCNMINVQECRNMKRSVLFQFSFIYSFNPTELPKQQLARQVQWCVFNVNDCLIPYWLCSEWIS